MGRSEEEKRPLRGRLHHRQFLDLQLRNQTGEGDTRSHEFSLQVRAFDANKSAAATGVGVILALCSSLLEKSLKGGLVVVGGLNLGGSIEPIHNAVAVVEAAADKGATTLLMPVTTRKQLAELGDDVATKVTIVYYSEVKDALVKALME